MEHDGRREKYIVSTEVVAKASIYTGCKLMMRRMGITTLDSIKLPELTEPILTGILQG